MFFISLLLLLKFGRKLFPKRIFLIFSHNTVPYNTVAKILQSNCKQQSKKYVPARSMWLNMAFIDLAKTDEKHCLTIDCSNVNKNRPG